MNISHCELIMIWVIGCNGMLGTEVCRQLKENNIEFTGTDRNVDICDYDSLKEYALSVKASFIINCAAYTAVDKAESDVEMAKKLNEEGPTHIARVAKETGATLIHISTDYVFDGTGDSPRTEDMAVAPIGVYGITKADGETAVMNNCSKFYILRTAWLYGWAGKNFVYTMIRAMNSHDAVKVVNDQKGTPTFAGDLADVILRIVVSTELKNAENSSSNNCENSESVNLIPYGIYHVTDLGEITWWDFTNEIKKQVVELEKSGKFSIPNSSFFIPNCIVNPCTTEEYPTPAKRPAYSVLSKEKIQKALGIKLPDWKESLEKFLTSSYFDFERIK